jgi:UPF0716 protein FxsA
MPLLLLIFIVWPVTELWLLFQLSDAFGFFTTLFIVFGTGILGAWLAKWQGLQAIIRVLLITPGVLSDVAGLLLLIPPFRKLVLLSVSRWFARHVRVQTTGFWQVSDGKLPGDDTVRDPSTVVEARVIDSRVVEDDK